MLIEREINREDCLESYRDVNPKNIMIAKEEM